MWLWIFEIIAFLFTDLLSFDFEIKKKDRKKKEEKK